MEALEAKNTTLFTNFEGLFAPLCVWLVDVERRLNLEEVEATSTSSRLIEGIEGLEARVAVLEKTREKRSTLE
jgi:hypothetical protein